MKIRILASGEIRHIDNSTGSALISAGLAEGLSTPADDKPGRLPRPGDAVKVEPFWEVVVVGITKTELVIRMTILGQSYLYGGAPDKANQKISWDGGFRYASGLGREIPEPILSQYKRQWKDNPELQAVAAFSPDTQAAFSSRENEVQAAAKAARGN
jgi:hypothetical protein